MIIYVTYVFLYIPYIVDRISDHDPVEVSIIDRTV